MKRISLLLAATLTLLTATAQTEYSWQDDAEAGRLDPRKNLHYEVGLQGSFARNKTPLWLNANKHGLSSLDESNGYARGSLTRPLSTDDNRHWGMGYGLDVALPYHYSSDIVVQQAYVEGRWYHGTLTVGAKEYPMELKNNRLSSGSQTLGINARPVPQVRLALPKYWVLPIGNDWLRLKGHIAFGKMTDDAWQHDFTKRRTKHADDVLYHSKAGYLMIGNPDRFIPLSLELGLEMATTFGGKAYRPLKDGTMETLEGKGGLGGMWDAFVPGGSDAGETTYKNRAGNQLGSWLMRVNYDADRWTMHAYVDKFFEDHSGMFMLDYDGYGEGSEWQQKKSRRYLLYDLKDMLLGLELNLKNGTWLRNIVLEYMYTKYQSGPIYHDHTTAVPDHIGGADNYYNHTIYTGWQHWGQAIGNPLFRSPIYNEDGTIDFRNTRFIAFHLGIDGTPTERLSYRALATCQSGWGTYGNPYDKKHHNVSLMVEAAYRLPKDWSVSCAYGMDFGHILGANAGLQLTVSKTGILNL